MYVCGGAIMPLHRLDYPRIAVHPCIFQLLQVAVRKVRGLIVTYGDPIVSKMEERRESKIQQRFGKRLRELRKVKGFSQEALALACDLDRSYVGGVERGERNISLINIYKISEALGIPARSLFEDPHRG